MSETDWIANSEEKKRLLIKHIEEQWEIHKYLRVQIRTGKQRTSKQNAAMRLYCDRMAKALNDAGYTVAMVLTKPLDIPWKKDLFLELVWRRVQEAVTGCESTTEPTRKQYTEIYDAVNNAIINQCNGVSEEWPVKKED